MNAVMEPAWRLRYLIPTAYTRSVSCMRPCLVGQCPGSRLGLGLQVPEAPTATDLLVDGCRSDSYMNVSCEDAASGSMCSWKHEARGLGMSVSLSPCLLLRRTPTS